jgi:glyoxylase-like metal-dependent hydrolase (beta-lactamase superfamily II)
MDQTSLADRTLRWRIGEVVVTRVTEFEWPAPGPDFMVDATPAALARHPWLIPDFVTPAGELRISVHALLVEAPGLRLVVDTCFGENKDLPHLAAMERHGDFLAKLAQAGFTRENVDVVLCTHLHVDHIGWNTMWQDGRWVPTFPNARYLFGEAEYAYTTSDDERLAKFGTDTTLRESVTPVVDAGLADFVATDHRLSPELRLIPTPGHTPGHVSLVIESRDEHAVITGDMMHHPCQIPHPEWCDHYDADHTDAVATRNRMLAEWSASGTLVIGTHFATPTAGRIVRENGWWKLDCDAVPSPT